MKKTWRLCFDCRPRKGSWNMAADEILFSSLPETPATILRFYAWERPTASLGCSQDASRAVDADFCRKNGVDIVRRVTGGKMVLHHREATYSIASSDSGLFGTTVVASYRLISEALALGLGKLGLSAEPAETPPEEYARGALPCFSHPGRDELQAAGKKILGSAQKRLGGKFLQHGSLPLEHDAALLRSAARLSGSAADFRMTSLREILGRPVPWEEAARRLGEGFSEFFGTELEERGFSPAEEEAIRRLQDLKYKDEGWTFSGRPPRE
ncbi:MAG: lipoate--protein ligase family protein [Candidatus Aminicenantes bacterium]|nr:lipoate--protein ligase family protein [Candidatus Aminicenantes bacterium]